MSLVIKNSFLFKTCLQVIKETAAKVSPAYPQVLHPRVQPTADGKYLRKKKFMKQNLNLLHEDNCIHSIYIVLGNTVNLETV